jgi:hypothetical protein
VSEQSDSFHINAKIADVRKWLGALGRQAVILDSNSRWTSFVVDGGDEPAIHSTIIASAPALLARWELGADHGCAVGIFERGDSLGHTCAKTRRGRSSCTSTR